MTTFNINDQVQVQLTDYGRACLRKNYEELVARWGGPAPFKFRLPEEDSEGWSKWQLWRLMEELGPHIGMELPFKVRIRLEDSE